MVVFPPGILTSRRSTTSRKEFTIAERKVASLHASKFDGHQVENRRKSFFDVKRSADDRAFLRITAKQASGQTKRASITVLDSEVQQFCQSVADAASFILYR